MYLTNRATPARRTPERPTGPPAHPEHTTIGDSSIPRLSSTTTAALADANEELKQRIRHGDQVAVARRIRNLLVAMRQVEPKDRAQVRGYLQRRKRGNLFSNLSHTRISGATRRRMLAALSDGAPFTERRFPNPTGYLDRVPKFDAERARRRNRFWKARLKWAPYAHCIDAFLMRNLPTPARRGHFDRASHVAWWQVRNRLQPDGIIGPKTLAALRLAMGWSASCSYDRGEAQRSRRTRGLLDPDTFRRAGGWLVADFAVNSQEPRPSMRSAQFVAWARQQVERGRQLEFRGYSDCSGSEARNRSLRLGRARAAIRLLPAELRSHARPVSAPVHSYVHQLNATARERAQNRSVFVRAIEHESEAGSGGGDQQPAPGRPAPEPEPRPPASGGVPSCRFLPGMALAFEKEVFELPVTRARLGVVDGILKVSVALSGEIKMCTSGVEAGLTIEGADGLKVALQKAVQSEFGEVRFGGEIEQGRASKLTIGMQHGSLDVELAARANLLEPFEIRLSPSSPPEVMMRIGHFFFIGKLKVSCVLSIRPNAALAASAASRLLSISRAISISARGLMFGGSIGTATGLGVVLVGAGVGGAGVVAIGASLYMIAQAHRDGRARNADNTLANAYASTMASLTEVSFAGVATRAELERTSGWKLRYATDRQLFIADKNNRAALHRMRRHGEDLAKHQWLQIATELGPAAWQEVALGLRQQFGNERRQRRERILGRLWSDQVKPGKPLRGLRLRPADW